MLDDPAVWAGGRSDRGNAHQCCFEELQLALCLTVRIASLERRQTDIEPSNLLRQFGKWPERTPLDAIGQPAKRWILFDVNHRVATVCRPIEHQAALLNLPQQPCNRLNGDTEVSLMGA